MQYGLPRENYQPPTYGSADALRLIRLVFRRKDQRDTTDKGAFFRGLFGFVGLCVSKQIRQKQRPHLSQSYRYKKTFPQSLGTFKYLYVYVFVACHSKRLNSHMLLTHAHTLSHPQDTQRSQFTLLARIVHMFFWLIAWCLTLFSVAVGHDNMNIRNNLLCYCWVLFVYVYVCFFIKYFFSIRVKHIWLLPWRDVWLIIIIISSLSKTLEGFTCVPEITWLALLQRTLFSTLQQRTKNNKLC